MKYPCKWNLASQEDWRGLEGVFIGAYIAAYEYMDTSHLALEGHTSISYYFKEKFQQEKTRILNQNEDDLYKIQYIVAYNQDLPVGFISFQLNPRSDRVYLRWITVLPEYQRQAIGKYLMDEITKGLPAACGLELYARISNVAARDFYMRCGFRAIDIAFNQPEIVHSNDILLPPMDEEMQEIDKFIGFYR